MVRRRAEGDRGAARRCPRGPGRQGPDSRGAGGRGDQKRGLGHIGKELASSWGTLLKPLAWQGDLALGPSQGNRVTFVRPDQASSHWAGLPEPDDAAPAAILAYLSAYGPATVEGFSNFISRGRVSKRSLKTWFAALGDRVTEVDVDGEPSFVRTEDLDELAAAKPTKAVRLLPGFDQWVLGPGTDDPRIVARPPRRGQPTGGLDLTGRRAGWRGGWHLGAGRSALKVAWFSESGSSQRALNHEASRLETITGRDLDLTTSI